jgi:heptosyltransferase II
LKILVRATNWVGDAVMSLPALHALRAAHPRAHIAIQARPWVADVYSREPFCDQILLQQGKGGWHDFGTKWQLVKQLRKHRFDMAILLQNAFESAAMVAAAGIRRRIGYNRDGRGLLLTDAVTPPKKGDLPDHQRFYYLELLKRARVIEDYSADSPIHLSSASLAAQAGRRTLEKKGIPLPLVGVSPGAAYGGAKRWLPERFAESAAQLARELGGGVVIFGAGNEADVCQQVDQALTERGVAHWNFAGQTSLAEFIELAANCTVFLSNDSGPMHLVSALGLPLVTVFGATDHVATGPTSAMAKIVREPVDCAPCLLRECPIDHRCMTRVSSDRVTETALQLLQVRK